MGVIYYKLEDRYEGDSTKGCGLTGPEIDGNFHFLRGYDIKDVTFNDGLLAFKRVNGDEIVVEGLPEYVAGLIDSALSEYEPEISLEDSAFNRETGVLTIMVNGEPFEIEGFVTDEERNRIYVGEGLLGKGTKLDPVRVNHINDTGFLATVERVIDYDTDERLPMPKDGGDVSKRYLTREQKSPYGLVYAFSAVTEIDRMLKEQESPWRVPTFEDWVMMLNAQECEDEYRNHGDINESSLNGNVAGQRLKDISWNEETAGIGLFNVLPIYYETFNTQQGSLMTAPFWSSTVSPIDNGAFGKRFIQKFDGVETIGKGTTFSNKLALRLVRDVEDGADMGMEVINGIAYKTVTMPTYSKDESGNTVMGTAIWTKENVTFDEFILDGSATKPYNKERGDHFIFENEEEYDAAGSYIYYTNYWDPIEEKWFKRQLVPNDVVIVHDYNGSVDKELIVALDENNNQILKPHSIDIEEVLPYIEAEASARTEADRELWEAVAALAEGLSAETIDRISGDTRLEEMIINLSGNTVSAITNEATERAESDRAILEQLSSLTTQVDVIIESALTIEAAARQSGDTILQAQIEDLSSALTKEILDRISGDTVLDEKIDAINSALSQESVARINADTALQGAINNEASARTNADAELQQAINNEVSARTNADAALQEAINNEASARTNADVVLQEAINNEASARTNADTVINGQISALTNNLAAETAAREQGDVDAKKYSYDLYQGKDAIKISESESGFTGEDDERVVSLKITESDKVLSQNDNGLKTTLKLNYQAGTNRGASATGSNPLIQLLGINDEVISEIDASDFVKSGLLERVILIDTEEKRQQEDPDGDPNEVPYLLLEWSTAGGGSEVVRISLSDLIDVYVGGSGITVNGDTISIDIDETNENEFLTVSDNGLKLQGVRAAIDCAKTTVYGAQGNTHVTVTGTTKSDGHIEYTISENDIASDTEIKNLLSGISATTTEEFTKTNSAVTVNAEAIENIADILDTYKPYMEEDLISSGETGTKIVVHSGATLTEAIEAIYEVIESGGIGFVTSDITDGEGNVILASGDTTTEAFQKIVNIFINAEGDEDIEVTFVNGVLHVGLKGVSNGKITLDTKKTITLMFNLMGGSGTFANITASTWGDECNITLPAEIPTKAGATFGGWEIDANGDTEIDPVAEVYTAGETVTLINLSDVTNVVATAKWE